MQGLPAVHYLCLSRIVGNLTGWSHSRVKKLNFRGLKFQQSMLTTSSGLESPPVRTLKIPTLEHFLPKKPYVSLLFSSLLLPCMESPSGSLVVQHPILQLPLVSVPFCESEHQRSVVDQVPSPNPVREQVPDGKMLDINSRWEACLLKREMCAVCREHQSFI